MVENSETIESPEQEFASFQAKILELHGRHINTPDISDERILVSRIMGDQYQKEHPAHHNQQEPFLITSPESQDLMRRYLNPKILTKEVDDEGNFQSEWFITDLSGVLLGEITHFREERKTKVADKITSYLIFTKTLHTQAQLTDHVPDLETFIPRE